jgi:hypothetical protein
VCTCEDGGADAGQSGGEQEIDGGQGAVERGQSRVEEGACGRENDDEPGGDDGGDAERSQDALEQIDRAGVLLGGEEGAEPRRAAWRSRRG